MKPENQKPKALKAKAWKLMSEIVRRKYAVDGYVNCFTCDKSMEWRDSQAGHGIGGRTNYLLFECEECIRPQCKSCNVFKGGMYHVFIPKLIELYGLETYQDWVIENRRPHKYTKGDYVELVDELQARLDAIRGD